MEMKPLRADGARNRELILAAAANVFALDGFSVPLDKIAKAAGVGRATLYRNFASREELGLAVFERNVGRLEALAGEAPQSGEGFHLILSALFDDMAAHAALGPALQGCEDDGCLQDLHDRVIAVLDRFRVAGIRDGSLREDLTEKDLGLLLNTLGGGLGRGESTPRDADAKRIMDLLFAGLQQT